MRGLDFFQGSIDETFLNFYQIFIGFFYNRSPFVINVSLLVCTQIHLMVHHGSTDFGCCGICDKKLVNLSDDESPGCSKKLKWNTIKYHVSCHLKQLENYKLRQVFNERLFPPAVLYKSEKEFEEELENRKNSKVSIILTDEQIAFYKLLGQNNFENQIVMEMLAS